MPPKGNASFIAGTSNSTNIEFEDLDIEEFELATKGAQYFLIILYSLTAFLALVGNSLAIAVLLWGKRSSRELRLFLVNLSLSDVFMSIFSIPFTYTNFILGRWIFWPNLCPFVQSMQVMCVFVSIYTLTIIGFDRYIVISRPFMSVLWSKSYAPTIVITTWLVGAAFSVIIWFYSKAEPFIIIHNQTYYDCREIWTNKTEEQIYTVVLFVIVFAAPLCCLLFAYGSICIQMCHHSIPGNANTARDGVLSQAKQKVIKMLIIIVALFAMCWLPMHVFQLIRVFDQEWLMNFISNDASSTRYLVIVISSHWLSMANSFVNPFIYCFMSDNFRADTKTIFKKCFSRRIWCYRCTREDQNSGHCMVTGSIANQTNHQQCQHMGSSEMMKRETFLLVERGPVQNSPKTNLSNSKNGIKHVQSSKKICSKSRKILPKTNKHKTQKCSMNANKYRCSGGKTISSDVSNLSTATIHSLGTSMHESAEKAIVIEFV